MDQISLTEYSNLQVAISNPGDNVYGTYTFVASTVYCGSTRTVSRVLRKGQCTYNFAMPCNPN